MIITKRTSVKSSGHNDIIDITGKVAEAVSGSRAREGSALIFVPGSTASVTTMEHEPNLAKDIGKALDRIAPYGHDYEHHKTWGDDNGSSHVRASIVGSSLTVPFMEGRLILGEWQQIVVMDFDTRPRDREIVIQISGE